MRKLWLYMKLNIFYLIRNKVRFGLTIFGIIIGLIVFLLGNVIVNAYIGSLYKKANNFTKDSFLVHDEKNQIIDMTLDKLNNPTMCTYSFWGSAFILEQSYMYKKIRVQNGMSLIGVEANFINTSIPYMEDSIIYLSKSNIIYGRGITNTDIQDKRNVVVIEKSTSKFIFRVENSVGKYIEFVSPYGYMRLEIIGIIEDLPSAKAQNLNFNKSINDKCDGIIKNHFCGYMPYSYLNEIVGNKESLMKEYVIIVDSDDSKASAQVINTVQKYIQLYGKEAGIRSREILINEVRSLETKMKGVLAVMLIVILALSGFMIMTIFVFSVKERVYEIGVRRALGASQFDIVKQFIFEGMILAVTGGITTILLSLVLCNLISAIFLNILYLDIRLIMDKGIVVATMGLSVLQGIIFSFIPAIIASKIRPTEAIRWD